MQGFINIIVLFIVFCAGILAAIRTITLLQQKGYKLEENSPKIRKERFRYFLEINAIGIFLALVSVLDILWFTIAFILLAAFYIIDKRIKINDTTKVPLKYTNRVKRLFTVYIISFGLCLYLISYLQLNYLVILSCFLLLSVNNYHIEILNLGMSIFENLNNERYIKVAKTKLKASQMIKIGITGSFGKTSVKNILCDILSKKYSVLKTIKNYNTPLGISLSVDDKNLHFYDIFIAEMGARYKGDIDKLVDIVKPQIAITTGIAPQHLSTFKSIDNIVIEKSKLAQSIPQGGLCVFNLDNELSRDIYNNTLTDKIGVSRKRNSQALILVENIKIVNNMTQFDIEFINGDKLKNCKTQLLGNHNIDNIAQAVAVARHLGVSDKDIQSAIRELKPTPHRLEIVDNKKGITILDDTYNANIEGVKCAYEVLAQFEGRKVVLTQGITELGEKSAEINFEVGKRLAKVADLVMLTGANASFIEEGLKESNFSNIVRYDSLCEAQIDFRHKIKKGDVLLLQNDLIDIS